MPMQWHKLKIVGKCAHGDGYDQELVLWVEAFGRENAVAKAMIDNHLIADAELESVEVLSTKLHRPTDWNVVSDKDRGSYTLE